MHIALALLTVALIFGGLAVCAFIIASRVRDDATHDLADQLANRTSIGATPKALIINHRSGQ